MLGLSQQGYTTKGCVATVSLLTRNNCKGEKSLLSMSTSSTTASTMPTNPPFGGSIAAEALLRLTPDDRLNSDEPSSDFHESGHLWLVQYRRYTTQFDTFDSGLGCTTNVAHAKEACKEGWLVMTYQLWRKGNKLRARNARLKQIQEACNEIPHGFGKWSPLKAKDGNPHERVGTSDNCELCYLIV